MKFTVETIEELKEINEKLSLLPQLVREQISHASSTLGENISCSFKNNFSECPKYYLPNNVWNINISQEVIVVRCDGFIFKIPNQNFPEFVLIKN